MDEVGWLVLIICFLTGSALFFSLNNFALKIASRVKMQDIFKESNKECVLEGIIENMEKLILTCTIFRLTINICTLLALTALLQSYLLTFIVAVLLMGLFSMAIPYAWAKYCGEKILLQTYPALNVFIYIATPVLFLLKAHDTLVRRLAGLDNVSEDQIQEEKQEEILNIVEQGRMQGVVDEEEAEMIENVLELSDTIAEEIMTPRTDVIAIPSEANLQTVLETIAEAGHSRIPVYDKNIDNIVGLIYAKDLLAEIGKKPDDFKLKNKMREAYFVPESKPLRVLLHEFQNQKLHIAVVLDEYGGTAGIVTIEDILEELVGEIVDEYEETPPEALMKIDETTIEIDARMYVDDLNSEFELELPEDEDYDTVGGFVFAHLGYIPKQSETFDFDGIRFTIIAAEARRIRRIRIQKLPDEQKPEETEQ